MRVKAVCAATGRSLVFEDLPASSTVVDLSFRAAQELEVPTDLLQLRHNGVTLERSSSLAALQSAGASIEVEYLLNLKGGCGITEFICCPCGFVYDSVLECLAICFPSILPADEGGEEGAEGEGEADKDAATKTTGGGEREENAPEVG